MEKTKVVAWFTMIFYLFGLTPVGVYAKGQPHKVQVPRIPLEKECAFIEKNKGGVLKIGNAEIEIPAGALKKDTEISITKLPMTANLDEGLDNATTGSIGYRFEPKGTKFKKDVIIRMGYDAKLDDNETALSNLYTYYYNEKKQRWEALERVEIDRTEHCVVSKTNHFTDMINATLSDPENPEPVSININSIKSLEAADPNSGIPSLEGFEPNSQGSAGFNLKFDLPGGRAGMKPQVGIGYNSNGGSDECGKGFSIQGLSSITIDTRWGLPKYDGDDLYLLDGEKLKKVESEENDENITYYETEAKKNYEEIKKINEDGKIYWEIRSKDGRKRTYGGYDLKAKNENIYKYEFKITKEEDLRGNEIIYEYSEIDESNNYIWLDNIYYTGDKGNKGNYKVHFERKLKEKDIKINARGKYISKQDCLYETITIYYVAGNTSEVEIWKYSLDYKETSDGHYILDKISKKKGDKEYWAYIFNYFDVEKDSTNCIKEAFSRTAEWSLPSSEKVIQKTVTDGSGVDTNISASFSLFGITIASFSINSGLHTSETTTQKTLKDINGDGILDLVTIVAGNLGYFPGTGDGFDSDAYVQLLNLDKDYMEFSGQSSFNIGVGANVGIGDIAGVGGNVTKQTTKSYAKGMFVDVDGDGFVDYLESGKNQYLKNVNGNFEWTYLELPETEQIYSEDFKNNKDLYLSRYYVQEPYREWRAPNGGVLSITYGNTSEEHSELEKNAFKETELIDINDNIEINRGDGLFFVLQSKVGSDKIKTLEVEQNVPWIVDINYVGYKPFENLKNGGELIPKSTNNYNGAASSLYENGRLRSDWENYVTWDVAKNLIQNDDIDFANVIPSEVFDKMREEANGRFVPIVFEDDSNKSEKNVNQFLLLENLYKFDPIAKEYIKNKNNEPNVRLKIVNNNLITAKSVYCELVNKLSEDYQKHLVGAFFEGEWIYPQKNETEKQISKKLTNEFKNELITLEQENVKYSDIKNDYIENGITCKKKYLDEFTKIEKISSEIYNQFYSRYFDELELYLQDEHGDYVLKHDLSSEQEDDLFEIYETVGIKVFSTLEKEYIYKSDAIIPVDSETQLVRYDVVKDDNLESRTIEIDKYNSETDFSLVDYTGKIETAKSEENVPTILGTGVGGFNNWYYGVWNGYYEWDYSSFNKIPIEKDICGEKITLPPYSSSMSIEENNINVWQGPLSSVDTNVRTEGKISVQEEIYSAYIGPQIMNCCRYGGTAWSKLERTLGDSSKELGKLQMSSSDGYDFAVNANALGVGVNISSNNGSSYNYRGILDINGDSIPDIVQYDDNNDSSSFTYREGTKKGFGEIKKVESDDNFLTAISGNEYKSVVLGAGVSGSQVKLGNKGELKGVTVKEDSSSFSTGFNANGSVGRNIATSQFVDMNGDGLVDQVKSENNQYFVRLNVGDGKFQKIDYVWGDGFSVTDSDNKYGDLKINDFKGLLGNEPKGISYTGNSSLGGGLSVSVPMDFGVVSASASVSGSYTATSNQTYTTLQDINGDGLVDLVGKSGKTDFFVVKFNKGDRFDSEVTRIKKPEWLNSETFNGALLTAAGNGLVEAANAYTGGVIKFNENNLPLSEIASNEELNLVTNPFDFEDVINYSTGFSSNLSATVSVGGRILCFKLTGSLGGSNQYSFNTSSVQFTDINGDGLPDHILQIAGQDKMQVITNEMGKVGLLKEVILPQGGKYEIEYDRVGNTTDMPQSRYVMSKVTRNNNREGFGVHKYETSFIYDKGKYHRLEKDFYGFNTVQQRNGTGNDYQKTTYSNDLGTDDESGYYKKGMVLKQERYLKESNVVSETNYQIDVYPYARIVKETTILHDALDNNSIITKETEYTGYDEWGNVTEYTESINGEDKIYVQIDYLQPKKGNYLHSHPTRIVVDNEETIGKSYSLRKREGIYNDYGELELQRKYFDKNNDYAYIETKMFYDSYGNIQKVTDPNGAYIRYVYDSSGQYLTDIIQGGRGVGEYTNKITWDEIRGLKSTEEDENGQVMTYDYDDFERLQKIYSPYDDINGTPAVEYIYHTEQGSPWWTETKNKVSFDASNDETISTVVEIDGLGRKVRTAKFAQITDTKGNSSLGWNVSGALEYDEKGRTIKEGQTYFSTAQTPSEMVKEELVLIRPTITEYDELDRPIHVLLPDGSEQITKYKIANNRQITESIDPLGNKTITEKDGRDNIVSVLKLDSNDKELTRADYEYNELGEMLVAYDANRNPISVEYDLVGRRIALESKDSGRKEYIYDESSNLIEETDSVLREKRASIKYTYDGMNRLTEIDYPFSTDVTYYYGEPEADNYGANRIIQITDETGMISRCYGLLGEVVEESRTIGDFARINNNEHNNGWYNWWHVVFGYWWHKKHHKWYHKHHWHGKFHHHHPWYGDGEGEYTGPEFENGAYTSKMSYTSDYLGRMAFITYPDGETISYTYDKGGQVTGVTGERNGDEIVYVSKIGYDEYGQRSFIEYGNGVKTAYTYDENRRWLDSIETLSATQKLLQNMSYSFDRVGNVSGYTNDSGNYSTTQKYSYDSLYQLVGAKGKTEYKPNWPYDYEDHHGYVSNYEQSWRFDNIGNMKSKYSEMIDKPHNQHSSSDLNYSFEYTYDPNYAHRTISADNMFYTYDANGNIINERIDRQATKEELQHDVELAEGIYSLDYGIALPNQPDVETKPYSRSYIWNEKNQLKTSVENGFVVNYRYGEDGQRAVKSSAQGETLYFNNMWQMSTTPMGMRQTKHIFVGETRIATKNNWWKDSGTEYERYNTYYFHSDHLGSAQLITDWRGEEYERIEYTPYGELWIEKVRDGFETINYRFTGKEMDSETGLYYFGARYLDPKYSRWLSTDPALGDYVPQAPVNDEARKANGNLPGQGGLFNQVNFHLYHYAGNNPVRYIDPDGRDIIQLLDPDRGRAAQPILNKIPFGHAAVLVGNDSDGWLYYSNDGSKSTDVQWFSSKQEFFDNYAKDRATPFNYQEGSSVKTSPEQDKAMQTKAFELAGIEIETGFAAKETGNRFIITENEKPSPYNFLKNNCSQHVGKIALAGGVFTTGDLIPKFQILMDKDTFLLYQLSKSVNMAY